MSEDPSAEWRQLGVRLRDAREYLSLSQQDVAASTGIPRSAISDIERGQRKVDSLELRKLAKIYKRPVASLLGTDDSDTGSETSRDVSMLARAVEGLTVDDRAEVVRFAEFLRFQSRGSGGTA
ncbi:MULTISPECIES: helix-turn-helix domain-containing protein [Aeromicrobium]|uniref:Helix-turn-helix transcriptional regulator n=1 Tax=Aeromicrobium fastidiosum TaxID=52699 RepID=A0A641ALZ8_9ACTN|nr:helix-turn-helix transcriptional regulator [Aeromicrobium fastidiosum]KAA1378159.1 helix-turn-helix transcriptional regulator [Aeromicrobium fastidiosum]MBD8607943.1 helix-turn-helix transcriptional regulator [Aeromicrobium sp. CFBP 8757]MBP2389036.1 transcriptional regulator with XRE-family HTH domain [Aeromicrobium fastidiosum]